MRMVNVTDVRTSIRDILSDMAKSREPVVILQRSKPVAYLVDAESFENMQRIEESESDIFAKSRKDSLDRILKIRAKVAKKTGVHNDSTQLIRELREGLGRHE
ncbi:MAG: hypothetical protein A4E56_00392 [Pelotomaculum sp. PtaU1.Bin065]|nr:MAG: hypothetical protein A4E56_00392 [Pelotomaculum sp. PtaU1.Bin065]